MNSRIRLALLVALAVPLPFWLGPSGLTTAVFVLIAAVSATGLNILTGYAGQVSLGHAFFLATGAYTYAVLSDITGQNLLWLVAAGFVSAVAGILVGPIALRLTGLYLAVVTLGLVFIGQHILFNVSALSGGPPGRTFAPIVVGTFDFSTSNLAIGPLLIDPNGAFYYLSLIVLALTTYAAARLARSRSGRAMFAIRERPDVAALAGVHVSSTKVTAFAFSAFFGGLGGAMYVAFIGYGQPAHWDLLLSFQFIAAIIVGGLGTISGPLLGSIVVFALPTVLKNLTAVLGAGADVPTSTIAALLYGILIVCFLVFEPQGISGIVRRIRDRVRLPAADNQSAKHRTELPAHMTPIKEKQ
jgi:branched-chain amino acid transport system permease protein